MCDDQLDQLCEEINYETGRNEPLSPQGRKYEEGLWPHERLSVESGYVGRGEDDIVLGGLSQI